jgi:hypothetical protein
MNANPFHGKDLLEKGRLRSVRSSDVAVQLDIARVSRVLAPRRQLLLPVCVAWMVHVPTETSVTVDPDTAQMAVVCEVK